MKFEQFNPKSIREQRTPETKDFFDKKYAELHPEEGIENVDTERPLKDLEMTKGVDVAEKAREQYDNLSESDKEMFSFLKERYDREDGVNEQGESKDLENPSKKENMVTSFGNIQEIEKYQKENSGNLLEEDISFLNNAIEERLASMELLKEVSKEEQELFAEKGEASTERLYAIAKKIKAGKVFEDIEIPMYNEHSEKIEGFLKNL